MEPSNRTPGGFGRRVWQVALEEVGDISARRIAINAISRTLPQLSLGRVRTATLRALGLSLGARALVMGPIHVTGKGDVRELVSFGSDVVVTGGLHLDIGGEIRVGDQVYLGH